MKLLYILNHVSGWTLFTFAIINSIAIGINYGINGKLFDGDFARFCAISISYTTWWFIIK